MTGSCVLRETILKGRPLSAAGPRVSLYLSLYLSICVAVQVKFGLHLQAKVSRSKRFGDRRDRRDRRVTELSKSRLGRVLLWLMTRQLECDVNEDEEAESCACSRPARAPPGELGPYRGSILPELGRRRTVCALP